MSRGGMRVTRGVHESQRFPCRLADALGGSADARLDQKHNELSRPQRTR